MAEEYFHPGGLPDSHWARELNGKRLRVRLLSDLKQSFECEVVGHEADYENWHTCFLRLKRGDGSIITVNPFAIADYEVI